MSMEQETSTFLEALTKSPQLRVLSIMAERPEEELTKTQIAQMAGIGRTTLYRVWSDLQKMRVLSPSKQVGAVTLYKLNQESPIVQSVMGIKKRLESVTSAVRKIEEIRELEKLARKTFGREMPMGPSVLVKLCEAGAVAKDNGVDLEELKLSDEEKDSVSSLLEAGLLDKNDDRYCLTALGNVTAKGAMQIWRLKERETVDQTLSSIKVALGMISEDIRKIKAKTGK